MGRFGGLRELRGKKRRKRNHATIRLDRLLVLALLLLHDAPTVLLELSLLRQRGGKDALPCQLG